MLFKITILSRNLKEIGGERKRGRWGEGMMVTV